MLITDNRDREDLILMDRQVTDTQLNGKRMDLLTLKQIQGEKYQFLVLEVKIGNNTELKAQVAHQLRTYIRHVDDHFQGYKYCYEKQYVQKKKIGIIEEPAWDEIEITPGASGMIAVGGYSGIAEEQIEILKKNYPELIVQLFDYKIDMN